MDTNRSVKDEMYGWATELFPLNRSLTGEGTLQTLRYLKNIVPELEIHSVSTGTTAYDWTVPNEWNVREAWVKDAAGNKIIDFAVNNLHLVGYSLPIDQVMTLQELNEHLYSLPAQPHAIPYITSYYKERWGFCLSEDQRRGLAEGVYHVRIDSTHTPGLLHYGEVIIPGRSEKEIFLSTYVCHPSMGNNEISGPVVTTALINWIKEEMREHTFRIVFIPETIGAVVYVSRNLDALKANVKAGFVITCIGDDRTYSYLPSRYGNTLADKAAKHVLKYHYPDYKPYKFLARGSDERQYCAPGVDLPMCTIMRSKYGEYPEYHTSLDNLDLITPEGLEGGYRALVKAITLLECNGVYRTTVLCEPQLGKRGLYPSLGTKDAGKESRKIINFITYSDGTNDLIDLAEILEEDAFDLLEMSKKLLENGVIEVVVPRDEYASR